MAGVVWVALLLAAAVGLGLLLAGVAAGEVNSAVDGISYSGDGSTTAFTFPFGVFATSEVRVVLRTTATGAESVQTLNSDYTVADNDGDGDYWDGTPGGTVTFTTAPTTAVTVHITRYPPLTQTTSIDGSYYVNLGAIEDAFDKLSCQVQYLQRQLYRALLIPETEGQSYDVNVPSAVDRASGYAIFDADGNLSVTGSALPDLAASPLWTAVLDDLNLASSLASLGLGTAAGNLALRGLYDAGTYVVTDSGADPTGATDSTTVIQAAIDAAYAAGGGVVVLPTGTYLISDTLTMKAGVILRGDGQTIFSTVPDTANTQLYLADDSDCDMISIPAGTKNVTVQGLYLNGNGENQASGSGIVTEATAACINLANLKINFCKEHGVDYGAGYGWVQFSTIYRCYEEGLYVTGGDLSIFEVEVEDSDEGDTGAFANAHFTSTSTGCRVYRLHSGADLRTNTDGILIDASSNTHQFIDCYTASNKRYGVNNSGNRCTFVGGILTGRTGTGAYHAFYENGTNTTIVGGSLVAAATGAYSLYIAGSTAGYECKVSGVDLNPSTGTGALSIAAGKKVYIDGVLFQPEAAGAATRQLLMTPNTTTNGVGGGLRVGTSTDSGTTGISFYGLRDATGGYGGWYWTTRNASGEVVRLQLDQNGLLKALAGLQVSNGATSAGWLDFYEDSDVDAAAYVRESIAIVDLTNANLKDLADTAVTLVAAPGAGKFLEFCGASLWLDYGSNALTEPSSPDDLRISYTNDAGAAASADIVASGFITATADTGAFAIPVSLAGTAATSLVNKALVLVNTGADYGGNAANDTVMRVIVRYRIHSGLGL
jgi:hypothetical protein